MRWIGLGSSLLAVLCVGACASNSPKGEAAATPEETLCVRAAIHVAALMAGKADREIDASQIGDLREGCRRPEAATQRSQEQFHCVLAAKDLGGLDVCKEKADAADPKPN